MESTSTITLSASLLRANATANQPAIGTTSDIAVLVAACRQGDERAQTRLYQVLATPMYNTALRMLKDPYEAEDALHDAFIKAFELLDQLTEDERFPGWLKRIVVNRSLDALRRKQAELSFLDAVGDQAEEEQDHTEASMQIQLIKEAMADLPDGYRVILSLYLFEGYDHEEIAEVLHISSATSRSQYHRAKKRLIQRINEKS